MADLVSHKNLPAELEAELCALFDAAPAPKHLKHNLTLEQRSHLEHNWPVLRQPRLLGTWWKSKQFELRKQAKEGTALVKSSGEHISRARLARARSPIEPIPAEDEFNRFTPLKRRKQPTRTSKSKKLYLDPEHPLNYPRASSAEPHAELGPSPKDITTATAGLVVKRSSLPTNKPKHDAPVGTRSSIDSHLFQSGLPDVSGCGVFGSLGEPARVVPGVADSAFSNPHPPLPSFPGPAPLIRLSGPSPSLTSVVHEIQQITSASGQEERLAARFTWAGSRALFEYGQAAIEVYFTMSSAANYHGSGFKPASNYRVRVPVNSANSISLLHNSIDKNSIIVFTLLGTTRVETATTNHVQLPDGTTARHWRPVPAAGRATFALVLERGAEPARALAQLLCQMEQVSQGSGATLKGQFAEGEWPGSLRAGAMVMAIEQGVKEVNQRWTTDQAGGSRSRTALVYHVPSLNFTVPPDKVFVDLWAEPAPPPGPWFDSPRGQSGPVMLGAAGRAPTSAGLSNDLKWLQPSLMARPSAWTVSPSTVTYSPAVQPPHFSPDPNHTLCAAPSASPVAANYSRHTPFGLPTPPEPYVASALSVREMISSPSLGNLQEHSAVSPLETRGKWPRGALVPLPTLVASSQMGSPYSWCEGGEEEEEFERKETAVGDMEAGKMETAGEGTVPYDGLEGAGSGWGMGEYDWTAELAMWRNKGDDWLDEERGKRRYTYE